AALGGGEVEVQSGGVGDQQRQRRQRRQRREHFHVAAARRTQRGTVARLLPLGVEEAQLLVVAVAAERAPQPRHLPAVGAQAAPQETRLVQAAVLAQQRPAAARRAVAALPDGALAQRDQASGQRGEQRE